jgi:predicted nucleotidyltransferase
MRAGGGPDSKGGEHVSTALQDAEDYFSKTSPEDVVSAYLFGSHARGTSHRDSDVDVGVVLDRRRLPERSDRSRRAIRLGSELISALHRNDVQVVVLNDAPPELAAKAVSEGRRIHCGDEEADRIFVRDVLLRHADLKPFLARMRRIKLSALRER